MFTKAEMKALLARCEQSTGVRKSKVLIVAMDKLRAEIMSWPAKSSDQ